MKLICNLLILVLIPLLVFSSGNGPISNPGFKINSDGSVINRGGDSTGFVVSDGETVDTIWITSTGIIGNSSYVGLTNDLVVVGDVSDSDYVSMLFVAPTDTGGFRLNPETDKMQYSHDNSSWSDFGSTTVDEDVAYDWTAAHTWDENITVNGGAVTGTGAYVFCIPDPDDWYTNFDHEFCIDPRTEAALTITRIDVSLDANPSTELEFSIKYADAFIGLASDTIVDDSSTVDGAISITEFEDATLGGPKCLYFLLDADPDDDIKSVNVKVSFKYD